MWIVLTIKAYKYLGMKMKIRIRLTYVVIDDKGIGIYFVPC